MGFFDWYFGKFRIYGVFPLIILVVILSFVISQNFYYIESSPIAMGSIEETEYFGFEEWDYTVYDTVKDANCLYYCYHETNTSDCESACKMYKVKLYTDSYCNVSCSEHDNTTFNYTITIDSSQGTMIGAFLIDFDVNETTTVCNYKCYGKFGGYTY